MLPKKQEPLVLLADGELPMDVPVEATSGRGISDEALAEALPRLYLVNPNNRNWLAGKTKLKKRRLTSLWHNLRSRGIYLMAVVRLIGERFTEALKGKWLAFKGIAIATLIWGAIAILMNLLLPTIPGGLSGWLGIFLILVAVMCILTVPFWRWRNEGEMKAEVDGQASQLFLGRVTSITLPHHAQRDKGSFEWEFVGPDNKLGGGRQEVPLSRAVPAIDTPVLVAYKETGTYELL